MQPNLPTFSPTSLNRLTPARIAALLLAVSALLFGASGCSKTTTPPAPIVQTAMAADGGPSDAGAADKNADSKPQDSSSTTDTKQSDAKAGDAATDGDAPAAGDEAEPQEGQTGKKSTKGKADATKGGKGKDAADEDQPEPAEGKQAGKTRRPFPQARPADEFPTDMEWLNTSGPVRLRDLRGKFVLLDFWTYCCINCMHILPELKKLEQAYPNELVVIGVHSAKFAGEKDTQNIKDAILRYEIEHPVVNDANHRIWESFNVSSWPTISLIDPEGREVGQHSGEFKFEMIDQVLKTALPYYRENKLLDEKPIRFDLLQNKAPKTPLRYPGKVIADAAGKRLFIADSNHNRIVVAGMDGKLLEIIGSGEIGAVDGDYRKASFNHPQGMFLNGTILYVADTENHMLRKVDLEAKVVKRISGTGEQAKGWPGIEKARETGKVPEKWVGVPGETELNSPWDLWVHEGHLYIAMAGPHQIWKMPLDESEIGPYAGNGREDIVDGALMPRVPYTQGFSSFAQPSGLSSDGKWLFVADSEGSSVRAVPFDPEQEVKTVVGTSHLPFGRLFHFGDVDGPAEKAKLQHALGVAYHDGKIYVADTYNNKIKVVDAETGETKNLVGTGEAGDSDAVPTFDEPAGISYADGKLYVADTNNHLIRVVDIESKKVATLKIEELQPPKLGTTEKTPTFTGAPRVTLKPTTLKAVDGAVKFEVVLDVPAGWKLNPEFAMTYWLDAGPGSEQLIDRAKLGKRSLEKPSPKFTVTVPVKGATAGDAAPPEVSVAFSYYYCQDADTGVCKVGSVVFIVPLKVADDGAASVELKHAVKP